MPTDQEILDEIGKIKQLFTDAVNIIKNNVDGLRARINAATASGEPVSQDQNDAIMAGLQEIENTISTLPVATDVVETPPAPPEG